MTNKDKIEMAETFDQAHAKYKAITGFCLYRHQGQKGKSKGGKCKPKKRKAFRP